MSKVKLPKVLNEVNANEVHIDATPDGGYALRILHYYRSRCNEVWEVFGLTPKQAQVYKLMNKHQQLRAKELDKAIRILEGSLAKSR